MSVGGRDINFEVIGCCVVMMFLPKIKNRGISHSIVVTFG
jgi:hypothetical protein